MKTQKLNFIKFLKKALKNRIDTQFELFVHFDIEIDIIALGIPITALNFYLVRLLVWGPCTFLPTHFVPFLEIILFFKTQKFFEQISKKVNIIARKTQNGKIRK